MEEERGAHRLSDEDMEKIARRAADLVQADIYQAIGKGVVTKALWAAGVALLAAAAWLEGKKGVISSIFNGR